MQRIMVANVLLLNEIQKLDLIDVESVEFYRRHYPFSDKRFLFDMEEDVELICCEINLVVVETKTYFQNC